MANLGNDRNEVLQVSKPVFRSELKRLIDTYAEMDASVFFKLVHKAYDRAINNLNPNSLIFYHIHNPNIYAELNFVRLNTDANWLIMVREPVQSLESWAGFSLRSNDHYGAAVTISTMLLQIDNLIYKRQRSIGVRLEDLKIKPRKTIPALCKWMGIEESESLYEMTVQGKKWWGDQSSPDYLKDGMQPFGKTSIKRKVGSFFSKSDQFILRTLFYPFSLRFGYINENAEKFKSDLESIRPMLDGLFDFEKAIIAKTGADPELFMQSGSYLYLRSSLIERWDTLNKFGTYPNMISVLKI